MTSKKPTSNPKAEAYKDEGNKFFNANDFTNAVKHYTMAIKEDSKNHVYYSNRSAAYAGLKEWRNALDDASKCLELNKSWAKGYYRKGLALEALDRLDEAAEAFANGSKFDPTNQEYASRATQLRDTIARKRKAPARVRPDGTPMGPAEIAKEEGTELFKAHSYDLAAKAYTKALELWTEALGVEFKATCHNNRAACYQQYHNYPEVIKDCTECLNLTPGNQKALIRRGLALEGLEKYEKALEDFRAVLDKDSTVAVANQAHHRISNALRVLKQQGR